MGRAKVSVFTAKENVDAAQWNRRPSDKALGKGKTLIAFSALGFFCGWFLVFFLVVKFDFTGS